MSLDSPLNDCQSKAAAAGTARHERLKQPLTHFVRNSWSVVANLQSHRMLQIGPVRNLGRLGLAHSHGDSDRATRCLYSVEHQVGCDAMEQVLVTLEEGVAALDCDGGIGPALGVSADQTHDRHH